ncbi:hypothetical protein LCGC14_2918320, partial [marine sediment metagenome]
PWQIQLDDFPAVLVGQDMDGRGSSIRPLPTGQHHVPARDCQWQEGVDADRPHGSPVGGGSVGANGW